MRLLPDEPLSVLTERQKEALATLTAEARRHGVSIRGDLDWEFAFQPEVRPGRGRDVRIWHCDGEKVAESGIDVYGRYSGLGIGSIEWECAGGSEYVDYECALCPDEDEADS